MLSGGLLTVLAFLSLIHLVTPGISGGFPSQVPLCPDGWQEFRDSSFNGQMCYHLVAEPKTWTEAAEYCRAELSQLMHLDGVETFSRYEGDVPTFLGNYIFEFEKPSFWEYWTGMSVQEQRLMWEAEGPRYVERSLFDSRKWNWAPLQPSLDNGTCGYVTLDYINDTFFSEPLGREETISTFNNGYLVSLGNCEDRRPFICHRTPILPSLKNRASCPGEWVGNAGLQHCYILSRDVLPYTQAEKACGAGGGYIAPATTLVDQSFIYYAYDFYAGVEKYKEVTNLEGIWVQSSQDMKIEGFCTALHTAMFLEVVRYTTLPCNTTLPFMCIKPTETVESSTPKLRSIYSDPDELLGYQAFKSFPVSGFIHRAPYDSEISFMQTPLGIFNSTLNWQNARDVQFRKGIQIDIVTSQSNDKPYYVNISVPGDVTFPNSPAKREAVHPGPGHIDRVKRQFVNVNFDNAVSFIGYYTFGIYSRSPPHYTHTKPLLVRYSESDMYIYVASMRMRDWVLSDGGDVTQDKATAFNLLHDESYVSMLTRDFTSGLLDQPPNTEFAQAIGFYKGIPERITNQTLYIRVFVTLITGRILGTEVEQTVMTELERGWRRSVSGNDAYIPQSVKFRSTGTGFTTGFAKLLSDENDWGEVQVRNVSCPRRKYTRDGNVTVNFPATRIGSVGYSWERCIGGRGAYASAKCKGNYDAGAHWSPVAIAEGCNTTHDFQESSSTNDLKRLSELDINVTSIVDVLNNTIHLTLPWINLTAIDVIYVADILTNFLDFDVVTLETLTLGLDIVNNLLQTGDDVIPDAQLLGSAGNRIIRALDQLTYRLWSTGDPKLLIVRDYVTAQVIQQTDDGTPLTIGLQLEGSMVEKINKASLFSVERPMDVNVTLTDVAIYLPLDVVQGGSSKLTFHIYSKPDIFGTEGDRYVVNSHVAALRFTKGDKPITDLGEDRVTAIFSPLKDDKFLTCGYWDYEANENAGGWRTDGCTHTVSGDRIICECDHLTNFAILIDMDAHEISDTDKLVLGIITKVGLSLNITGLGLSRDMDAHKISDTDKLVLGIITKVGLSLSIIGLGLTVLTFIVFRHLRNGRGQQVLINLSTAMLCSSIVFLAGAERTESYGGCIAVAVLLHYFILVSFMWMLVEGVLQYLRFVKVLGTYIPKFMLKTMLPAWGVPLIPVIILLAYDYDLYYGGKGYCWLESDAMLYAFIIPVAVVIFANIIVFLMVMCSLCRRGKGLKPVNQSERKMAFLHFQAAISIFVVLGLTWVFGFFAIEDARIVFHYLFAIFNALQGLFIFLLFTAREKQIRTAWRKLCCKTSADKSFTSGSDSHAAKRAKLGTPSSSNTNSGSDSRSTGTTGYSTTSGGSRFDDIRYDDVPDNGSRNRSNMQFGNPEYRP